MNKEWLAETHGLTLAEIEWAFAMTQTLLAFSDHPLDAQHTIITSICGPWTDHFTCSIQDIQTIWEAESHLTMQQINWLLQGLSSESASQQLMHALDMLQQIDTESDVAYWEAQEAESEEDSDTSEIVEDDQIQTISDNEPADGEIDVQKSIGESIGAMCIRIYLPTTATYQYLFLDNHQVYTTTDLAEQPTLLQQWIDTQATSPCSLLSFEWHPATHTQDTRYSLTENGLEATQQTQYHDSGFAQVHRQIGTLDCQGGHRSPINMRSINAKKRTLNAGQQRLSWWSIQSEPLTSYRDELYWCLRIHTEQTLQGNGHRGGEIRLRNSVFTQVIDDHQRWLCGTDPEQQTIDLPKIADELKDSRQQQLQVEHRPSLEKHCQHQEYHAIPVFGRTLPFQQHQQQTYILKGQGHSLTGQTFIEQASHAHHDDASQRAQLSFNNYASVQMTGTLYWNNHTVQIQSDNTLLWSDGTHQRAIKLINHPQLQQIDKSVSNEDFDTLSQIRMTIQQANWCLQVDSDQQN